MKMSGIPVSTTIRSLILSLKFRSELLIEEARKE